MSDLDYNHLKRQIKETPPSKLGERMRQARKAEGLSLDHVAELAGTSRQHLIGLEKGRHHPGPVMLVAIARAIGVEVTYFLGGEQHDEDDDKEGDRRAA